MRFVFWTGPPHVSMWCRPRTASAICTAQVLLDAPLATVGPMKTRTLGQGLVVSAQGLGCMGMSAWYGEIDEEESVATIHRALDLGVTFLDTADMYGAQFGENEKLVGRAIADR